MDYDWLYIAFVAVVIPCLSYFGGKWYYGRKAKVSTLAASRANWFAPQRRVKSSILGAVRKAIVWSMFAAWHVTEAVMERSRRR